MSSFGRRARRHRAAHHKGLAPWAIILICVASALALSLLVGNLLKVFMDEEAYDRLVNPPAEEAVEATPRRVPSISAYPFTLGGKLSNVQPHASVTINRPDGTLRYQSPVSKSLGMQGDEVDFEASMASLLTRIDYISGVFYPQAQAQRSESLRYAEIAKERAILREFLAGGANEILLCGMDVSEDGMQDTKAYLQALRDELNAPVGVAVPLSHLRTENGWRALASLLDACDFLAIDIRGIENADAVTVLQSLGYYREEYGARIVIGEEQTDLIAALAETDVSDYQILTETN